MAPPPAETQGAAAGPLARRTICILLLLVADEQLSYEQVGALTDQSADAVRGKLHRARKAFAALFHQTERQALSPPQGLHHPVSDNHFRSKYET